LSSIDYVATVAVLYRSRQWIQQGKRPMLKVFRTAKTPNKDMPHSNL